MIKHLLKIIWNRKRVNGLILTEITLSFLVLFAVILMSVLFAVNYGKPLGFSIERVWAVSVDPHVPTDSNRKAQLEAMATLESAVRELPQIEAVAGISMSPYSTSTSIYNTKFEGREVSAHVNDATDAAGELLKVDLVAGRWFSHEDDGATRRPAVINERLAKTLFGSADPIGKELPFDTQRVVGVVRDFRKAGEMSQPVNYLLNRIDPLDTANRHFPWDILVRVKPGTTAEFQEQLSRTLESTQEGWTFQIRRLEAERESSLKDGIAPLAVGAVIAGFLLFMVALGLIGVLWQNISRRTQEIGLRRAVGGTALQVHRQILGELFVLTTFGLAVGSFFIVQVPLLGLLTEPEIPSSVYGIGFGVSVILMYLLTMTCGFYPSWLTMEIQPAEALHYE
jgi:putative ABC transport system permease protein